MDTNVPKEVLTEQFPEIEYLVDNQFYSIQSDIEFYLNGKTMPGRIQVSYPDTAVIDFFSFSFVAGNETTVKNSMNSVVVSETLAQKSGVDDIRQLIGQEIKIDGNTAYLAGIIKDQSENSVLGHWNNTLLYFNRPPQGNRTGGFRMPGANYVLLMKKGASIKDFREKYDRYVTVHPEYKPSEEHDADTPPAITLFTEYFEWSDYSIKMSVFLLLLGALILLTAAFNFISFQVSVIYNRQKSYAVQRVNGINGIQLFAGIFTELLWPFILSCLLTFIFIFYFARVFPDYYYNLTYTVLMGQTLNLELARYMIWGIMLLFLISLLLTHIVHRTQIHTLFFSGNRKGKSLGRYILLFIQMAVLLLFLCSVLIVNRQTNHTKNKLFTNLSVAEQENIICVRCNYSELTGQRDVLIKNIEKSTHILEVTYSNDPVFFLWYRNSSEKISGIDDQIVKEFLVSPNFLDFFHGSMLQGDFIDENSDLQAVVVNSAFAALFPDESVIGKSFRYEKSRIPYHVIGVMNGPQIIEYDIKNKNNIMADTPVFFRLFPRYGNFMLYAKAVEGKTKEAQEDMIRCLRELLPESYELDMGIFKKEFEDTFSDEKLISSVAGIFFFFSLVLGLVSIYSSVMTNLEKRRKEIAIRKINGAGIKDIILLFSKTYVILWTLVCIVVFPFVYYYAGIWLEGFHDRTPVHWGLFAGIYFTILALILLTVVFQILKVARENPSEVVKAE
jgi:ABC-type antimicrobial peptide transport system permease subunit